MSERRRVRIWIAAAAPAVAWPWACGGPQELGSDGAVCYRDDDCRPGLVCAAPPGSADRRCTSDVSGLISMVPGPEPVPADSGPAQAGAPSSGGGGAPGAAGTPGTAGGAPGTVTDAGTPDSSGASDASGAGGAP